MPFLIDSNIIIYSFSDEFEYLRKLLVDEWCNVSEISRVEVVGYHGLNQVQKKYFLDVFTYTTVIMLTKEIYDKAIEIRQQYNLKLGDSIIAASQRFLKTFDTFRIFVCAFTPC